MSALSMCVTRATISTLREVIRESQIFPSLQDESWEELWIYLGKNSSMLSIEGSHLTRDSHTGRPWPTKQAESLPASAFISERISVEPSCRYVK